MVTSESGAAIRLFEASFLERTGAVTGDHRPAPAVNLRAS